MFFKGKHKGNALYFCFFQRKILLLLAATSAPTGFSLINLGKDFGSPSARGEAPIQPSVILYCSFCKKRRLKTGVLVMVDWCFRVTRN